MVAVLPRRAALLPLFGLIAVSGCLRVGFFGEREAGPADHHPLDTSDTMSAADVIGDVPIGRTDLGARDTRPPDQPQGVTRMKLAAGDHHTCLLFANGRIKCWGLNQAGQLGYGHARTVGDKATEHPADLAYLDFGAPVTAVDIAAGQFHTCALFADHSIRCWGEGAAGNLGNESGENIGDAPLEMQSSETILIQPSGLRPRKLIARKRNVCVLYDDSSLRCNGQNNYGQLGQEVVNSLGNDPGEMGDNLLPIHLGSGRVAIDAMLGEYHVCALTDEERVKCWGRGDYGRLGLGHGGHLGGSAGEMGDTLPYLDLGAHRVKAIYPVRFGGCVRLDDDRFKCWGANLRGELGLGHTNHLGDANGEMGDSLPFVDAGSPVAAVHGGYHLICLILADRQLKCGGQNNNGQLGRGSLDHYGDDPGETWAALAPVDLGTGRRLRSASMDSIAVGGDHICAVLDDQSVKCWGRNDMGQLGLGDNEARGDEPDEMGDALPSLRL